MPFFELGEVYPPTWPNKPPGLLERDFIIWDMYRKEHFPEFEKFYYNVPITLATLPTCLLYTSPSPRDKRQSRMPSSA